MESYNICSFMSSFLLNIESVRSFYVVCSSFIFSLPYNLPLCDYSCLYSSIPLLMGVHTFLNT